MGPLPKVMAWPSLPTLALFLLCLSVISSKHVDPSEEEVERQLKLLNKTPVKTFELQNGDIFDCIDIFKQAALDHPLLKNHKIQMWPTSLPKGMTDKQPVDISLSPFAHNESCPLGTVIIRRTRKEDLLNANLIHNSMRIYGASDHTEDSTDDGRAHFALVRSKLRVFYGVKAQLNVYGIPRVAPDQTSTNTMLIGGGAGGPQELINAIHVGWHVLPGIYNNDTHSRFFIYWTTDGYRTHCMNTLCGNGFVTRGRNFGPGFELKPLSTYHGPQFFIELVVHKDPGTGNWWLLTGRDNYVVGYWAREVFKNFEFGNQVSFGGTLYTPMNKPSPPMCNGHLPTEGPYEACFIQGIELVNFENTFFTIKKSDVQEGVDLSEYYGAQRGNSDDFHQITYGGPGGFIG